MYDEMWMNIIGHDGYQISNWGCIKSFKRGGEKIMKVWLSGGGYPKVELYTDDEGYRFTIHYLVTRAFLGVCPIGMEVNHKNGVKSDNRISNLEYVTRSENVIHAMNNGLCNIRGEYNNKSKLTNKSVRNIRALLRAGMLQKTIADIYNVEPNTISNIKTGTTWDWLGDVPQIEVT